ncbi:MAG: helix-turn-helix transcriptional regulator [Desulfuromonadales bacterium]|nr:helix-turn-helix transcriptional regulator [Desulfuromonadales bacterium]
MSKKTYQRVMDLLNEHIPAKISRNEFCRITGINRNSVDRYRAGLGCPIHETLEKMAGYFGVSVAWLRGDADVKFVNYFLDKIGNNLHTIYHESGGKYKQEIEAIESAADSIYNATINISLLSEEASREYLEKKIIPHLKEVPELLNKMKMTIVKAKGNIGFHPAFGVIKQGQEYLIDEDKFTDELFEKLSPTLSAKDQTKPTSNILKTHSSKKRPISN